MYIKCFHLNVSLMTSNNRSMDTLTGNIYEIINIIIFNTLSQLSLQKYACASMGVSINVILADVDDLTVHLVASFLHLIFLYLPSKI